MVKKKVVVKQAVSAYGESVSQKEKKESKNKFDFSKLNYWMVASVVLAVVLLLIVSINSFSTISKDQASKEVIGFLVSAYGVPEEMINITSVSSEGDFYFVNFTVQSQEGSFAVSKDGDYVGQMIATSTFKTPTSPTTDTPTSVEVPKSDNPKVELYTWGYCPYGVQAQGPMAQVATLLKSGADFEIVPYYDGHGAYETQQNQIQLCIQKLAKDKYWSYAAKFVTDVYPKCSATRTEDCDKTESIKVMKAVGIDSTSIMACVAKDGDALSASASAKAQQNGVSGSPTVIINGVISNAARSAEAYKSAVCSAFNSAPSACSNTLDSTAAAAAGNC
jgi:hypothetical protein